MKRTAHTLIIVFACSAVFLAGAFASGPGTTAADMLKFGIGARPAGMGEAFSAVADDVNALYWNPAGLALLPYSEAGLMHNEIGEEIRMEFLGCALPLRPLRGTVAGSFALLTVSDIQGYDTGGAPTSLLAASDRAFSLGYGTRLLPDLSAGASVKTVTEKLDSYEATAFAADAGILYKLKALPGPFFDKLSAAAVVRNIGTQMKFIDESAPLPSTLVAALAYDGRMYGNRLVAAVDCAFPSDNDPSFTTGAEYELNDVLAVRCGYASGDDLAGGIRAGLGLRIRGADMDYAFLPRGDFGNSHRISVTYRFGMKYDEALALERMEEQFDRGKRHYEKGDLVSAYKELNTVLLVAPGHRKAREYLAKIETQIDAVRAKNGLEEHCRNGERYFRENRLGEAKAEFESILAVEPGHARANAYVAKIRTALKSIADSQFETGRSFFESGDYAAAAAAMDTVLLIDPEHKKAKEYAILARDKGIRARWLKERALEEEQKAAAERHLDQHLKEGIAAFEKKVWKDAEEQFREVLTLEPANEKARRYLADTEQALAGSYLKRGRDAYADKERDEALRLLELALQYDSGLAEAKTLVARIKDDIRKQNRDAAYACNTQALQAYAQGNLKEAIRLWTKTLELDPGMEAARVNLERAQKELKKE